MNKRPKIEIKSKGHGITQIYIDGHELNGVRQFKLSQYATDMPILTVDLNALDISVEGEFILRHEGFAEEMEITFKVSEENRSRQ